MTLGHAPQAATPDDSRSSENCEKFLPITNSRTFRTVSSAGMPHTEVLRKALRKDKAFPSWLSRRESPDTAADVPSRSKKSHVAPAM
jgi:hypothetical protein